MGGIVHGEEKFVFRLAQKALDLRRQDVVADGFGRADAKARLFLRGKGAAQFLVLIALADGVGLKRLALRRFFELAAVVGEKAHAVERLKRLDLLGDGRLRQVQALGRLTIVHRGTEHQKCFKPLVHALPLLINNKTESTYSHL